MIIQVVSSVLLIIAIALLMGLTPEQITEDLMRLITPNDSMRDKVKNLREHKKKHGIYRTLLNIKSALSVSGKSKQFALVICASLVLFVSGAILAILINNLFLLPVFAVSFALLPFFSV